MKALITGASSGIGKAISIELSLQGYDLILVARNIQKLNELKNQINTHVEVIGMDISKEENCYDLYQNHKDVDILVNDAGLGDCGHFDQTSLEKDIQIIHTNIIGLHTLTKLYLQNMKEKDSGIILNVASIGGFMPGPLMATYYASKAYVVRLSEAIREELKKEKSDVQISLLCPGPVNTHFNQVANVQFSLDGLSSEYVARITIKRLFKGKFYIIPGWKIKIAKLAVKIAPTSLVSHFVYRIQKQKIITTPKRRGMYRP